MTDETKTPITGVRTVGVPVTDQDRDQDGNGLEIVEQP
jgi:hypothetical protein